MNTLNIKALAIALGLSSAVFALFLGWVSIFGWGTYMVDMFASFYIGYSSSFFGAIIGAIWAFIEGAVFGVLIGYFYNYIIAQKKRKRD